MAVLAEYKYMSLKNSAHLLDERRPFVILRFIVISATVDITTPATLPSTAVIFRRPDRFWRKAILIALISVGVRGSVGVDAGICSTIIIVLVVAASN
jgi:hypothetical protein